MATDVNWFRRSLDCFDTDTVWDDSGHVRPVFPKRQKEPWRDHHLAADCLLLPYHVVEFFAEERKLNTIARLEPDKVSSLAESIATEGLTTPVEMVWDPQGKFRYHDGYHRLTAMRTIPEKRPDYIPVVLKQSDRVHGYGKMPERWMDHLLSAYNETIREYRLNERIV